MTTEAPEIPTIRKMEPFFFWVRKTGSDRSTAELVKLREELGAMEVPGIQDWMGHYRRVN